MENLTIEIIDAKLTVGINNFSTSHNILFLQNCLNANLKSFHILNSKCRSTHIEGPVELLKSSELVLLGLMDIFGPTESFLIIVYL